MVRFNMIRAITTPIKSVLGKGFAISIKNHKKEEKDTIELPTTKPKIKGIDCIFMMHEILCLEVYEDGYIKRI
ncbi:MAG: hypothetical protein QXF79_03865 [Ignisphaera sp.]